jgi:2-oxo-4-hydroxy-4-carboxy-5-ureidoimidazoline decarboxylase
VTIEQLNALSREHFVAALGHIYEHSPWIAEGAWNSRPFLSLGDLAGKMNAVVESASKDAQLTLLRAHPELGTRLAVSEISGVEQSGAGLNTLFQDEYDVLKKLNDSYCAKFGFPFIFAVKGSGKDDILIALSVRVHSDPETEFRQALWEVSRIARFRLADIVKD